MKAYSQLEKQFSRIHSIDHASSILGWDEAVMMPSGSGESRAQALAELKVLRHEILMSPKVLDLLNSAEFEVNSMTAWQRANLREMKHIINNARSVDKDLVEAISLANSRCEQAWRSLRFENNWNDFLPLFENVVSLAREEAQQRSYSTSLSPYDSLLDQYNPGLTSSQITTLFNQVKTFLPDLIQRVLEKQRSIQVFAPSSEFSIESQKALGLHIMSILGFDFRHGRLDVSHHPFCGGVPQDVRITTRYSTTNFIESLMGVIHETGHARYEQGLPREWIHQPVGMSRGMHIHESQSLLYEIFIGRSREFICHIQPIITKYLAKDLNDQFWNVENLYNLMNQVRQTFIRVNADEVTYPAHIILRYEIERDLISGSVQAKDVPELWDIKMQSYLGLSTKDNHRDGCMQDMHWAAGAFGYFPSYSLGAMTAAQLFSSMKKLMPNLEGLIGSGNLLPIQNWLKSHIWALGSFSSTNELLVHATGELLNPTYFRQHIEEKYLNLSPGETEPLEIGPDQYSVSIAP